MDCACASTTPGKARPETDPIPDVRNARKDACSRLSGIDRMQAPPQTSGMAAKTPATPPSPVAQFETSLDELEQLVQKMEKGDLSLDDSLAAYERGVGLYRQCQSALEQAELRVQLLSDPADPDSAQPFQPDAA